MVKRFAARLDSYKAEATAFAERIRGELTKAEIYRAEVEAASVGSQMQLRQIETYRAQIAGIEASVGIYRVQMEGANIRASIERTKLEAFRASVEAYTAQVQAKVAEFGAYRAQIDGETAKVQAFEAQVRAFTGQVAASKTKSDVQLGRLQAESEQARVRLASFQAEVDGYKANVQRLLDAGRLETDLYRADVESARATTDGLTARASLQEKALEAAVQQNIQISNLGIENAKAKLLATVEALRFRTAGTQYAAEKFYALLTSYVSTINTLATQSATDA